MPPVADSLYLSMETAATGVLEEAESRYKSFVQNPTLSPYLEHRRWTLGPGRLKGQTGYDFIARGRGTMEGVQVLWGPSKESSAPNARRFKLLIGSQVLWRHYANQGNAYTAATELLEWITGDLWSAVPVAEAIAVRRLDVCVDHWGYGWKKKDLDHFSCRKAGNHGLEEEYDPAQVSMYQGATSATYYVGSRGSASRYLRIYNKIAEAQKSGKLPWMQPLWRAHGWDGEATVWRAEVEFGGEWLRSHGFTDLSKLKGCEHAVWLDYIEDVRHTTGTRSRAKRCSTSRVWKCIHLAVLNAAADDSGSTWQWKPRDPRPGGDMKQLAAMLGGCGRKIGEAMFTGPNGRAELLAYIAEALDLSEERHRQRQAHLVRHNPRPPPPPRRSA